MYKLLTVNVWDTLIRRNCHPDSSKLASAYCLSLTYRNQLHDQFRDHWQIFRERCLIEGELARQRHPDGLGEYELSEVLQRLLERIALPADADHSSLVQDLVHLELDFELRHSLPDDKIIDEIERYPAERKLFLSDFYMSAPMLTKILERHGFGHFVDGGLSSCDIGANKRSGALFRHVHDAFGVLPKDHLHIGDNLHADVEMARYAGASAVHFQPEQAHSERMQRSTFLADRGALFKFISEKVTRASTDTDAPAHGGRSAFLLGTRVAPLFAGFVLMIAENALADQVQQLFFFTREGEFFIQVWKAMFPDQQLKGMALPEPKILEVSRIATFGASLREVSIDEMMRIWNLYSVQSLLALCRSINVESGAVAEICGRYALTMDESITYPWQDQRIQDLFGDPAFVAVLRAQIATDRGLLVEYLASKGLRNETGTVGVVDIGWRGTIHDNIAWLYPEQTIHGYYLGLQRFLNEQPTNCRKSAFGPDANHSDKDINLLDAVSVVEMLCNSPFGSVLGYATDDDGKVSSKRLIDEDENSVYHRFTREFQNGVRVACQEWATYLDAYVVSADELRPPGMAIWAELVTAPSNDIAQAYASLNHNELFGVGSFKSQSAVPTIGSFLYALFSRPVRANVILYLKQTQWPSGVWMRTDLSYLHRLVLVSALRLALGYKRLRNLRRKLRGN